MYQFIYSLRRPSDCSDTISLLNFYCGMIYPRLKYGITIWGKSTQMKGIFTVHKNLFRKNI